MMDWSPADTSTEVHSHPFVGDAMIVVGVDEIVVTFVGGAFVVAFAVACVPANVVSVPIVLQLVDLNLNVVKKHLFVSSVRIFLLFK
jgi:hypothetical protein